MANDGLPWTCQQKFIEVFEALGKEGSRIEALVLALRQKFDNAVMRDCWQKPQGMQVAERICKEMVPSALVSVIGFDGIFYNKKTSSEEVGHNLYRVAIRLLCTATDAPHGSYSARSS